MIGVSLAAALSGAVRAEPSVPMFYVSGAFVVLPATVPEGERTAAANTPLWVQDAVSARIVRLKDDLELPSGNNSRAQSLPRGTLLFGVELETGWAYCVARDTANETRGFPCFEDADRDNRFEGRTNPADLFAVPPKPATALPSPVGYEAAPYADAPKFDYAIMWRAETNRGRRGQPAGPIQITAFAIIGRPGARYCIVGEQAHTEFVEGTPTRLRIKGVEIEILGLEPSGAIRYRVLASAPLYLTRENRDYDLPKAAATFLSNARAR